MADRLIAIDTGDPKALGVCVRSLEGLGEVTDWLSVLEGPEELDADLLVFDLGPAAPGGAERAQSILRYAQFRKARPGLPILLLAPGVTTELAVELIKLGAQDLLASDTGDGQILRRKVERLLGGPRSPVFSDPIFAPFEPAQQTAEERRRAFRAPVPEAIAARIHLRLRPREIEASLLDISLETDGFPGAILVRFPSDSVDHEVFRREELVASSAASISLPDGYDPVDVSVLPVRVRQAPNGRTVDVAFQYRPLDPDDSARLARFWMQCQVRARN